ncbi:glycosyltransferase [Pseudodonghicola flavimaris]|uniref:Glycosyltransferase n=1 Tax=Pseudodonghicola flavimaris TaxID=3050036 RepID=A0ABT7F8H4_9RHOB|nr:glycosyltransferase [Pseudodonghicola flavimaris]MDK3020923.1 glycosyltransferase [Pseudodonghicola flavimaris]
MFQDTKFVGRYDRYPETGGDRKAEGGLRLQGGGKQKNSTTPLVTIITVCWNSAETIEQTIKSVIAQTYSNIEYIIVDGASKDSTIDIVRKYEKNVDYYVSEPDRGIYDAMNKGLELAQGDYILLLNSDDWYQPDAVSRLVAAQQFSGCSFTGSLARYVNEDGSSHVLPSMTYDKSVLLRMPLRHETMLIPAALYDRIGPYDTAFPIIADFELTVRLYQAGATYYEVGAPLLNFRTSGVSNTALDQLHGEHRALLSRVFPFLSEEELHRLGDHSKARPEDFIEVANAHLDQPDFVLAVRSMLRDFKRLWGGPWGEAPVDQLAANDGRYPDVSIVMPVHNAAAFVTETVQAVLSQDLQNIEVICVNDCSSDETAPVIEALRQRDPRVRLLNNLRNLGPGGSRNVGIRAARGKYVFFLDADDGLPAGALSRLFASAQKHESSIVRGAFQVERRIHGQMSQGVKYPAGISDRTVAHTTLSEMPELLASTEGHWAALYERDFVETILYPEKLRMGEDSLFLTKAISLAPSITLIPDVVYVYKDNAESAMNTYDIGKYMDEVDWRRRSWGLLDGAGQRERADFFLFDYWNPPFFGQLDETLDETQHRAFYKAVLAAFRAAGAPDASRCTNPELYEIFQRNFIRHQLIQAPPPAEPPVQVAILTTSAQGGAGIASQRSMTALREAGVGAFSICIFKNGEPPNVFGAPLTPAAAEAQAKGGTEALWQYWLDAISVDQAQARELFSGPGNLVMGEVLGRELSAIDVIHLHWVSGMLDYPQLEKIVNDRPVVWTLHDMNPFTGGCHYSEGCEGYKDQCRDCPLLAPGVQTAHENWQIKRDAYSKIENLHIVCPSQWLADCARQSSLFEGREIHVIPNIFPVGHFTPTNKMVARLRLGLPLDRKYIIFGADSLDNRRKGGQYLQQSIDRLVQLGAAEGVEGLFFGSANLDTAIPGHNMGYISDPKRLSLLYAAADVFAFPSLEDNAPQTVVEALLSGTPVVGFPVGNVPELVTHHDTGYIAEYGDAEDFAAGLAWALENPRTHEAQLRGLRGHIHARNYHNQEAAMNQCLELYRRIRHESSS